MKPPRRPGKEEPKSGSVSGALGIGLSTGMPISDEFIQAKENLERCIDRLEQSTEQRAETRRCLNVLLEVMANRGGQSWKTWG